MSQITFMYRFAFYSVSILTHQKTLQTLLDYCMFKCRTKFKCFKSYTNRRHEHEPFKYLCCEVIYLFFRHLHHFNQVCTLSIPAPPPSVSQVKYDLNEMRRDV